MNYLALYFLIGAIVAIWTALNNLRLTQSREDGGSPIRGTSLVAACLLIALAWPLSLLVFFYALINYALGRQGSA